MKILYILCYCVHVGKKHYLYQKYLIIDLNIYLKIYLINKVIEYNIIKLYIYLEILKFKKQPIVTNFNISLFFIENKYRIPILIKT